MFSSIAILVVANAQVTPSTPPAFVGSWIGTLTYRDYSDNSLQKLGTLVRIYKEKGEDTLVFRYVYDDGPKKVLQESETVQIDWAKKKYIVTSDEGKQINSYDLKTRLKPDGTGELSLTGKGTENNVEVDVLTTIKIKTNQFKILRQTRPKGANFAFRHEFSFSRVN